MQEHVQGVRVKMEPYLANLLQSNFNWWSDPIWMKCSDAKQKWATLAAKKYFKTNN